MKIVLMNKTHWRDDHIRAFLVRGIQMEREDLCKRNALPMMVRICYTRGWSPASSGCAYLHSRSITVRLPKNVEPDRIDFAHTIVHELAHTRGLTHDRMNACATYGRVGNWREVYAWAGALPLGRKLPNAKPSSVVVLERKLTLASAMLKTAMTREKRAKTIRQKWQRRVTYYTKRAAAMKLPQ